VSGAGRALQNAKHILKLIYWVGVHLEGLPDLKEQTECKKEIISVSFLHHLILVSYT
jgi:hypothetical protein